MAKLVVLRETTNDDAAQVLDLVCTTFGRKDEGKLVARLVTEDAVVSSVVAEIEGEIVGHAMFSRAPIVLEGGSLTGAALAPVSVRPAVQRRGIGSAMIRQGLQACRDHAVDVVLVLGDPKYYRRFGFSQERARKLRSPWSGQNFQSLELREKVLDVSEGVVRYPKAFSSLGT